MFRQSSKVQSVNATGFAHPNSSVSKIQKRRLMMKDFVRWGVVIFFPLSWPFVLPPKVSLRISPKHI
jgi:hypothetical protein